MPVVVQQAGLAGAVLAVAGVELTRLVLVLGQHGRPPRPRIPSACGRDLATAPARPGAGPRSAPQAATLNPPATSSTPVPRSWSGQHATEGRRLGRHPEVGTGGGIFTRSAHTPTARPPVEWVTGQPACRWTDTSL